MIQLSRAARNFELSKQYFNIFKGDFWAGSILSLPWQRGCCILAYNSHIFSLGFNLWDLLIAPFAILRTQEVCGPETLQHS